MQFAEWLDQEPGRANEMAAHFGVTKGAISNWKYEGVPSKRMLEVRDYTGGEVTLEQMLAFVPASRQPAEQGA